MTITHISDTARWVAFYRARESERPDAIIHDPYARGLAGPEGEAIVRQMESRMRGDWPMIVRTAVMDEIILRLVRGGVKQVLNLAAGLDARPWRLDLPAALHWVDVDLPDILEHKLSVLAGEPTRCAYEAVRLDLADLEPRRDLLARVGVDARETLVITEGLLIYLSEEGVAQLAHDLHELGHYRWWLCDLASPGLLRMMEKSWGRSVAQGGAPFRFAPAESTAWFAPLGWREAEYRSTFHEGIRLNRTFPLARFWAWLARLGGAARAEKMRRFSGIGLLEKVG